MSQIGGEPLPINISISRPGEDELKFGDEGSTARGAVLLAASTIGLLGNIITLLLVLVVKRFQKPYNSFFIHQCILDSIKSAYCIVFSKSLFDQQPPTECAILGASYIVFVTTSAFNILAVTVNEIYHFTNRVVGIHINNRCCVLFGLCITWFASIIVNLGVAFLPGNPTFDRAIGYCTFMYGVTGNYLLHVLWIILITFALLLTVVYLRKLWMDIEGRAYYRISTLFHQTIFVNLDERTSSEKTALYKRNIKKTMKVARKNFFLLASIVLVFVVFWYPLFILTLVDPFFRAQPSYYRSLTIFAWCHSSLTPVFFLLYNHSSLKEIKESFRSSKKRRRSMVGSSSAQLESTSSKAGVPKSPIRPSSLNVKPSYNCDNHLDSGQHCRHNGGHNGGQNGGQNGCVNSGNMAARQRTQSLASAKLIQQSSSPRDFYRKRSRNKSIGEEITYHMQSEANNLERQHNRDLVTQLHANDKFSKMASVYKTEPSRDSFQLTSTEEKPALSGEVIDKLLQSKLSPTFVRQIIDLQERANRRSVPHFLPSNQPPPCQSATNERSGACHRSVTFPERLGGMSCLEVEVDDSISPSTNLSVHRLSTGCLASSPLRLSRSLSNFDLCQRGDWV